MTVENADVRALHNIFRNKLGFGGEVSAIILGSSEVPHTDE